MTRPILCALFAFAAASLSAGAADPALPEKIAPADAGKPKPEFKTSAKPKEETSPAAPAPEKPAAKPADKAEEPVPELPESTPATPDGQMFPPAIVPPLPDASGALMPPTLPENLIPPTVEIPFFKKKKSDTEKASDAYAERVRYRQAKTRAINDPQLQAALQAAEAARTDYDRREAMKRYYALMNSRISTSDKSLKTRADNGEKYFTRRLMQTRVDPTEPVDPAERGKASE